MDAQAHLVIWCLPVVYEAVFFHYAWYMCFQPKCIVGPRKLFEIWGSLSQRGLIMVPGQKANGNNLEKSFQSSINNGMLSVPIRITSMIR